MKIRTVYTDLVAVLQAGGIEQASFEAKQLVCGLLSVREEDLLLNRGIVTEKEVDILKQAARKRCMHYPLQYLIGEWEFFGLPFTVGEGVLIPRQDTETLCEVLLDRLKEKNAPKIIDLCSGSGCIAIVLDHYLKGRHQIYALEKSVDALYYLEQNSKKNGSNIIIVEDDALIPQTEEANFDVVVSNPPYLNEEDMHHLQKEVSYEPSEALYAPKNGYLFYEKLTEIWKKKLKPGGILAYEIGVHQEEKVSGILKRHGFENICLYPDLCGIIRVVLGEKRTF